MAAQRKLLKLKIDSLTLDPNNARRHTDIDVEAIAKSLEKFTQQTPIVVTSDNLIIKGNGTVLAAMKLGWTEIEAVRTTLTGQEQCAYSIADNETALKSSWDVDKLLESLQSFDEELLASTGFDNDDILALLGNEEPAVDVLARLTEDSEIEPKSMFSIVVTPDQMETINTAIELTSLGEASLAIVEICEAYSNG